MYILYLLFGKPYLYGYIHIFVIFHYFMNRISDLNFDDNSWLHAMDHLVAAFMESEYVGLGRWCINTLWLILEVNGLENFWMSGPYSYIFML